MHSSIRARKQAADMVQQQQEEADSLIRSTKAKKTKSSNATASAREPLAFQHYQPPFYPAYHPYPPLPTAPSTFYAAAVPVPPAQQQQPLTHTFAAQPAQDPYAAKLQEISQQYTTLIWIGVAILVLMVILLVVGLQIWFAVSSSQRRVIYSRPRYR